LFVYNETKARVSHLLVDTNSEGFCQRDVQEG
jgi:hypothetical protein